MIHALMINAKDSVAVVTANVKKGTLVSCGDNDSLVITAIDDIPVYHKIAIKDIEKGEKVLKYGCPIGEATEAIAAGSHVHSHNMVSPDGKER